MKWTGRIHGILWPLAAFIYLIMGFTWRFWHLGWLIFPLTIVLAQTLSLIANIILERR